MMMNLPCLRGSCHNFLRPIYHTLSASQTPKRGHAPRKKTMPATALVLCLIVTDRHSPVVVLIYSVDANHLRFLLVFCRCSPFRTLSFTGFCSRTLSSLRCIPSATRQNSGFDSFIYYAAIGACEAAGCLISFNSFCGS